MRFNQAAALSFICALAATTAACTELPEGGNDPEQRAADVADGDLELAIDTLSDEPGFGVMAREGTVIGRYLKLLFGSYASALERIQCDKLNMIRETYMVGGCAVTVENQDCRTDWSEQLNQYVCTCDVAVVGTSGAGCGPGGD